MNELKPINLKRKITMSKKKREANRINIVKAQMKNEVSKHVYTPEERKARGTRKGMPPSNPFPKGNKYGSLNMHRERSLEQRAKLSIKMTGRKLKPEHVEKITRRWRENPMNNPMKNPVICKIQHAKASQTKLAKLDSKRIIKLYNEGYGCVRISKMMNVSHDTVLRALERNNIPRRTYSQALIQRHKKDKEVYNEQS